MILSRRFFTRLLLAILATTIVGCSSSQKTFSDWNEDEITWFSYEDGLAEAAQTGKPILMIMHAEWCPHCERYRSVFHDKDIVKKAEHFIFIIVDIDEQPELSAQFAPDGEYVPRTIFLDSTGELQKEFHGPTREYKYFLSTTNPDELYRIMARAQKS